MHATKRIGQICYSYVFRSALAALAEELVRTDLDNACGVAVISVVKCDEAASFCVCLHNSDC